jgi:hypothetical protein
MVDHSCSVPSAIRIDGRRICATTNFKRDQIEL